MELVKQGLTPVIGAAEEKELNPVHAFEEKEDTKINTIEDKVEQ
jgi:hypothetical protein